MVLSNVTLFCLQGIQKWVVIKSSRGEPVGAVQVALHLSHVGDTQIDRCLAAPSPVGQVPVLKQLMSAVLPSLPQPLSAELLLYKSMAGSLHQLPAGFYGQWCRCSMFVDDLLVPISKDVADKASQARQASFKYCLTYKLPGKMQIVFSMQQQLPHRC